MRINFQEFSFCWYFCFAYSLSKMALKLTSKIPTQVFFRNSSIFPAISDNLWLGGKHSWLWIESAGFKSRLDQKFFIWYFCCLMVFSLCDKYCCCQKCGLPIFLIFRSLKMQITLVFLINVLHVYLIMGSFSIHHALIRNITFIDFQYFFFLTCL